MLLQTVLFVPLLFAQAESSTDLELEVRSLVRRLDGADLKVRVSAEQELIELGMPVLKHLPDVTPRTSPEVAQRLNRIRRRLLETQVVAGAEASRVTISAEGLAVSQAFASIEKQTGNKIVDLREQFGQDSEDPEIDLKLENVTFWEALDAVLDLADMTVYPYSEDQAVGVVRRGRNAVVRTGTASYDGPFRIEATEVHAGRSYRDPKSQSMSVTLEVAWEPRLTPIVLEQPLSSVTAKDENEKDIEVTSKDGVMEAQMGGSSNATELTIPLVLPPRSTQNIGVLTGTLQALLPGKIEKFEFDQLENLKAREVRKAAATVAVDQVRRNGSVSEVYMRLRFDEAAGALESHRGWVFNNKAYLIDPMGQQVEMAGFESTKSTPDEIGVAYLFEVPPDLKGYKFVYETPAAVVSKPIKYELKDLDLP